MNLLTDADLQRLKQRYAMPEFEAVIGALRETAETQMKHALNVPDEGAGWTHNYTCTKHATRLTYDRDKPHMHVCSVDGEVYSGGVYDEAWRGFRNHELIRSAQAAALLWAMNGEQPYLDHAATVLGEYAKRYDNYPVHGKNAGQGRVMGQSLDEAVWSIPAAWAYDLIREGLDDSQRTLIETELLHGLGAHLLTQLWTRIHNIQCWHLAGLATLSVVLDEERYMQPVFDKQWGFAAQVQEGVLEDGWWWEGSPHYHFYTTQAMTSLGIAVRYRHPELLDNARFQRMFTAPLEMLRPDLSLPSLNDGWIDNSWPGGIAQYVQVFERAHSFWGDPAHAQVMANIYAQYTKRDSHDALLFGPDALPEAAPLEMESALQSHSGYAILKSENTHLLVKYGPHGGGHGHPDKLALELWGYGQALSPDLGTPGYGIPMNNSWYRHTLSHNTVLLNSHSQPPAAGQLRHFQSPGASFGIADVEVTWEGSGSEIYDGVTVRRCVLWKAAYFVDIVRVHCPEPRLIDLAWHQTGTLDMDGPEGIELSFDQPGYEHLTTPSETWAKYWDAIWRTATGPGTRMWAYNPDGTQTLVAGAPFNPASEVMSLILRRINAAQAMFLSVIAPFSGQPAIHNVIWGQRDNVVTIQVDGDGIADLWQIPYYDGSPFASVPETHTEYTYRLD